MSDHRLPANTDSGGKGRSWEVVGGERRSCGLKRNSEHQKYCLKWLKNNWYTKKSNLEVIRVWGLALKRENLYPRKLRSVSMDRDEVDVNKNGKKNEANIQPS